MPPRFSSTTRQPKATRSGAADRFLTPVYHGAGELVGWRFTPGPRLRAMGAQPAMLKDDTGAWLSHRAARARRDQLVIAAERNIGSPPIVAAIAVPAAPDPASPRATPPAARTLQALADAHQHAVRQAGAREGRSADTVRYYASYMKPWLDLFGAVAMVAQIEKADVIEALDIWALEGASLAVRAARYRALQAALAFAERSGWIDHSPARRLSVARAEPRKRRATDQEIAALVATADRLAADTGNPDYAHVGTAIVAAVWTAQRQGDLLACSLGSQLVPAMPAPAGRASEPAQPARLLFQQSKTGARVGPPLMLPLAHRLAGRTTGPLVPFQEGAGKGGGKGGNRSKPLEQASHWKPDHFRHRWAEIRAAAGVSDLTFGDLRDTAITRLYEAGANALQIASWSGHSLKTVHQILEHYIDHQNSVADEVGIRLAAWATARGISV
jgi:integrase